MPLPALHCRFAQAIAKTAMAPDLSLRGRFAPVAISGRHCRSVLTTVEMSNAKVWGVAALSERHAGWQYLRHTFYDARLPDLSLRGPEGAVAISGRQLQFRREYPVVRPGTARLPRRFAPRNDTSGSMAQETVHCTELVLLLPLRARAGHAPPLP